MPELDFVFREYKKAIDTHMLQGDWHFVVNKDSAHITSPVFQGLQAFWPSILSLTGDVDGALLHLTAYHEVWKQYGFIPEGYNFLQGKVISTRAGYLLRPEFIESVYHIYRATRDPWLIQAAVDVFTSIEQVTRTECGYATVLDVTSHTLENRMESFFLSETTKYLYLIFDEDNFIHDVVTSAPHPPADPSAAPVCYPESGGYVFNTEAHPMDPGALGCCAAFGHDDAERLSVLDRQPAVEDRPQYVHTTEEGDISDAEDKTKVQLGDLMDVINDPFKKYFTGRTSAASHRSPNGRQSQRCSSESAIDLSILEMWKELNDIVLQFPTSGKHKSVLEENDDPFSIANLEAVRPPLLTCRYPAFHERFTLAGQLATQI